MSENLKQKSVQKHDLYRFKFQQGGSFSPDGRKVLYGLSHLDVKKDTEIHKLWLHDLESGEKRQLTFGDTSESAPMWSPCGKFIAFRSVRGDMPQIFIMPVDGGEALQLTDIKAPMGGGPLWSPDGKKIAFTAGPVMETPPDPSKPYRITRNIYRFDGAGYLHNLLQDIYVIDIDTKEQKKLSENNSQNTLHGWSPDGTKILFTTMFKADSHEVFSWEVKTVDLEGEEKSVCTELDLPMLVNWMPDSKGVVLFGVEKHKDIGSLNNIWVTYINGKKPENRTASLEFEVGGGLQGDMSAGTSGPLQISKDGKKAYVNVQQGGEVHIYEVALTGKESYKKLVGGERCCSILDNSEDLLLYATSNMNRLPDLYTCKLDGSDEKRLTRNNCDVLQTMIKPEIEHLLFKSIDGEDVEGWYMKPTTGEEGPWPTVLYIHGGPHSAFGHIYSFDFQMLAGAGFGVLFLNQRASTGYGEDFSTAIKGDWGNLDYHDLMYGVDYAIEKGLADGDKLGVCGISGGGNLSCWIIGQTDRFKAAVPENPVTNWFSMYGVSDVGVWFSIAELGGAPHEIPEVYAKCSPLTYAHNCTTPTLLVQGEHDFRCPAEQSEQFYAVLKAEGCIVEMLRLPNSPHAGSVAGPPSLRKAQNDALLDWMSRYVMGKTAEEQK